MIPADPHPRAGRARRAPSSERDSGRPAAPVDSGHRPRRQARRPTRKEHPQRRLRAAVRRRRLDVRRRGRARPGVDDVARQPAQPEAGHPSRPRVPAVAEQVAARDEPVGAAASSAGRSSPTGARSSTSRPRSSARAACTSTTGTCGTPTAAASRRPSSTRRSTSSTTTRRCATAARRWCCICPRFKPPRKRRCGTTSCPRSSGTCGLAGRHDQGLRARRAARGVFPADGDPRRARQALRRLQHRPLGLHQQRRPTRWPGIRRFINPEHRRDHDDLRLHAATTRTASGAPCNTPDSLRPATRSGRAAWSPTSRSARKTGVEPRMERAVAGAEREQREGASGKWVAHWKMVHIVRPGLGASRARRTSSVGRFRRSTYTPADADGLTAARAGAANDPRRARSAERGAAIRQRVRPGHAGRGAQAGRLLRQRRRAVPDGRHGDGRDPAQHPVGMAAQGRAADRRRRGDGRQGGRRLHARACSSGCWPRSTRSCGGRAIATSTTTRRTRRCRSRARSSRPTSPTPSSCRGTSTC